MVVLSARRKHTAVASQCPANLCETPCRGENYLRIYVFTELLFTTMAPGAKRKLKFSDKSDRQGGTRRKVHRLEVDPDPAIVTTLSPTPSTSSRRGATTAAASGGDQKRARVPKTAPTTPVVSARGRAKRGSVKPELPLPQSSPTIGYYSETTMVSRAIKTCRMMHCHVY